MISTETKPETKQSSSEELAIQHIAFDTDASFNTFSSPASCETSDNETSLLSIIQ